MTAPGPDAPGFRGPALLILAGAGLLLLFDQPLFGLPPDEAAVLLGIGAVTLFMAGRVVEGFREGVVSGVNASIIGTLVCGLLAWGFTARGEVEGVLDRLIGDVAPGRIVTTPEGEVVAARRLDGSFTVNTQINGHALRMTFDTGASTMVLRAEDAEDLGLKPETLTYSVPVATANGSSLAALTYLDTVTIGPITERRVPALVARPGVLHANLLGMTFLERLNSYEVRGNRLILRGKPAS
ncbi:retropepsin-like aspartic protease family protein [Microvirga pudoricolor]|uniref:retropepsin-like aspartic protease family protein n=1 Tax=Microvirga pudoricolor TaxID=2778729 RepID=UPI00194F3180|nr:TIGR02281 family clan AA aspartic protease [Microvirga pudoricolor]MBM6594649.1 TIGR02281 family clan AA aspartic protease [Microvirga pudoricolor]